MSKHVKLYIPGPVEVSADTYAAMSAPMIGHRGKGFQDLYAEIQVMVPSEPTEEEKSLYARLAEVTRFDPRE